MIIILLLIIMKCIFWSWTFCSSGSQTVLRLTENQINTISSFLRLPAAAHGHGLEHALLNFVFYSRICGRNDRQLRPIKNSSSVKMHCLNVLDQYVALSLWYQINQEQCFEDGLFIYVRTLDVRAYQLLMFSCFHVILMHKDQLRRALIFLDCAKQD